MTFWYGSGSADPYLRLTDPVPDLTSDPAVSVSDLQEGNTKLFSFLFITVRTVLIEVTIQ